MGTLRNSVFLWRRGILSLLIFSFVISFAFGQGKTVKGKVTSATEGPLPGVNIVLQGTTQGTMTDAGGNYTISVPNAQSVLVFSFISYTPQSITVGNQSTIDVVLAPAMSALNEVVVTGYGTQKKREVTSSITSGPRLAPIVLIPLSRISYEPLGSPPALLIDSPETFP